MTAVSDEVTSHVGSRQLRKEDPALLTGEAKYVDDLDLPGALWMTIVRSPFAHAKISSIDFSAALAAPGVVAAYSGADLADLWAAPMPCAWVVTEDMKNPPHYPVTPDVARYVGDAVAVILATSRYEAADAATLIVVDYEELPAVASLESAISDETQVYPDDGTNAAYTWDLIPDPEAVEQAFNNATHTVKGRFVQQRLIPSAIEPRGVAAVPSPFNGEMTMYSSTQIPHILKVMTALTIGYPEHKLRIVAPSVGGGFGSKLDVYAEELLCTALANKLNKAVRWTETRSEGALSTIQGRGQIQEIELAANDDGKITAVRTKIHADMGAYMQLLTGGVPLLGGFLYHGIYDIPNYSFSCTGHFTNLVPTDAYRGAGRPEATFAIERAMDLLAQEVGIDVTEIRRRNFIPTEAFPYESAAGLVFDSGDYAPNLDIALSTVGYEKLRDQQQQRRDAGDSKLLGIGVVTYAEMCGLAPSRVLASLNFGAGGWEHATVRMLPTGVVQVVTGATPSGQGHETAWSQIVADKLGVEVDAIEVLHSDTSISPHGLDTYGSRSLSVGGTAIFLACDKVIDKARLIAAHTLEANADDLEYANGVFSVRGTEGSEFPLAAAAFGAFTAHDLPDGMEPTLEGSVTWDPPNFTFPFGSHVAVVEIDSDTGSVEILDYVAVDDCGNQVNPMIVEGQLHGGILQGIAQALYEEAVYDENGQPKNVTFGDYLVPSATEAPSFRLDSTVTPSPTNPMGVKGVGEAGTIGSAAAIINAISDGLSHLGISDVEMPASPERIWNLIQQNS